ncbi:hypothetical protein VNO77_41464 [Canavalia gladiata]|uniref:Uncharacterized protein n=1 Tax=Canavalia gladiata TaxID=3824 RepID=A0AAN9PQ96_CANGL
MQDLVKSCEGSITNLRVISDTLRSLRGLVMVNLLMTFLEEPSFSGISYSVFRRIPPLRVLLIILWFKEYPLKNHHADEQQIDSLATQSTNCDGLPNDLHVGEMTIRDTLASSAGVQGVGPRYDLLVEAFRGEKQANISPDPDIDDYMKTVATEG